MNNDIIKTPEEGRALYEELVKKHKTNSQEALEVVAEKLGETQLVTSYYIGIKTAEQANSTQPVAKGLSKVQSSVLLTANTPENIAILLSCEEEIDHNYQIVQGAVAAWLRMGFALARAKSIIKHGNFQKWRQMVFPELSKMHLSNAQRVAEKIIEDSGTTAAELNFTGRWDTMISTSIGLYGLSSQQQLYLASRTNAQLTLSEEEHKKWCLAKFEERPDWADEYMPLIETGERTWTQVMMALMGREKSVDADGNRRQHEPYLAFYRHVQTLPGSAKTLGSWEKIPVEVQTKIIDCIRETIKFIPPQARHLIQPSDVIEVETSVTPQS